MRDDFGGLFAASPATLRRDPTTAEVAGGLACGAAGRDFWNEMLFSISSLLAETNTILDAAAIPADESKTDQLLAALRKAVPAGAKIPFNERLFMLPTRVSMSLPANSAGVSVTGASVTFPKVSATSRLIAQGAFTCYSPIIIGQGAAAVTQRLRASIGATVLQDEVTVSTGALIGTNAPFHVGNNPVWAIDGLPIGNITLDILFRRDDNLAWTTVVNPTGADVPGFPSPNVGKLIVKEEEV